MREDVEAEIQLMKQEVIPRKPSGGLGFAPVQQMFMISRCPIRKTFQMIAKRPSVRFSIQRVPKRNFTITRVPKQRFWL